MSHQFTPSIIIPLRPFRQNIHSPDFVLNFTITLQLLAAILHPHQTVSPALRLDILAKS